jgi:hypothetical protein
MATIGDGLAEVTPCSLLVDNKRSPRRLKPLFNNVAP